MSKSFIYEYENGNYKCYYNAITQDVLYCNKTAVFSDVIHNADALTKRAFDNKIDYYEIAKKSVDKHLHPSIDTMFLLVNERCNLYCEYCRYIQKLPDSYIGSTMELSTGIKLVDKFLEIKKTSDLPTRKTIVFFGTEVLLNAELISDLAYYIREKEKEKNLFVELVLFTNGMIINEKIIRCLRDCNITPIISIDGWAELHDKARKYRNGVGTYAVINDNCKKLMSHNIRFGISTAVGEHNIDFLPDIIKHFYHEFKPINIGLNPMEISSKYSRDVFFEKYIQSGLEAFKIAREFGISIPQIMRRIRPFVEKKCRIKECPTCGGSIRVYPNGTVGTCSHFVAEGNHCIDLETFKKNNLNEVDVFTSWSQRTQFNFEKCKYCEAITLCGGGCVYNAYLQNGDIWTPDNRICTHSKLSLQWCIWDLFDRINGAFKLGDDKNSSLIPTMEERRLIYMNIDENSVKLPLQRYNSFGEIKFEKMEY